MMNDAARDQLVSIISEYGKDISKELGRCEGLLRDKCPKYKKEANAIICALRARVAEDLLASSSVAPSKTLISRMQKRLTDVHNLDEVAANWAVISWALALDVITQGQAQSFSISSASSVTSPPPFSFMKTAQPKVPQTASPTTPRRLVVSRPLKTPSTSPSPVPPHNVHSPASTVTGSPISISGVSAFVRSSVGLAVFGALALVSLILTLTLLFSTKRSILRAAGRGELVSPIGKSAFDLYFDNKNSLNGQDIAEISEFIFPKLDTKGGGLLTEFREQNKDFSEAEWNEISRIYRWMNDLRPEVRYEARDHFAQGRLAFVQKNYSAAATAFREAAKRDSSWALPYNALGRTYINMKPPDKPLAMQFYRKATEMDSEWIYPWINLGQLCLDKDIGDYNTARGAMLKALSIDPNKPSAHYFLGAAYEGLNQPCDALSEYQRAAGNSTSITSPLGFRLDTANERINKLSSKCQ